MSLHAAVAVSLCTAGQVAEAGNRVGGVVVVRLPLSEPDPGARLRLVCADSAYAKLSQLPTTGNGLLVARPAGADAAFIRRQRLTNLVESNVIGPPAPIRVLGAPVLDLVPIGVLAGNVAVSFLALSCAGSLTVTVRADADRYPTCRSCWPRGSGTGGRLLLVRP